MTPAGTSARIGAISSIALPSLRAEGVGLRQHAQRAEAQERHRPLDERAHAVGAVALHELRRVEPLGQRQHAQLEALGARDARGAEDRLLPGVVGVEREVGDRREPAQRADLVLGDRGAHDAHGVLEARLPQRDDVGVALDDDDGARLRRGDPRMVRAVHDAALREELALGGVQVLRRAAVGHRPRAEADDAAADVGQREHDPLAEAVGPVLAEQPGGVQLAVGEAGAPRGRHHLVPRGGRVARRGSA
jgi:hypothetical protein